MFRIRPAAALLALSLIAVAGPVMAVPAVSTAVAFSLSNPVGNPVKGPDGALYGTANPVTSVAGGVIWRAAVDGSEVRTIYQLTPDDAVSPSSGLAVGSDGLLYGTTRFGKGSDVAGAGSIFKIAPGGSGFAVIFRFAPVTSTNQDLNPINTNGAYPEAELIEGHDGMLYGAARSGGPNGTGTLFRVARDGTGFQLLHAFANVTSTVNSGLTVTVDGAAPTGQLVQDADGVLYGTASAGGNNGRGTVFRLNADGTGFQVLHHFSAVVFTDGVAKNEDGTLPLGGLVDGNDGFLYGMASQAGANGFGVIYAIKPDGSGFDVLHTFSNTDGARPLAELRLGTDGKLYGTTSGGGVSSGTTVSGLGTFFVIDRTGTNFAKLHDFVNANGTAPASKVIEQAPGVFLGLTGSAGNCGYGTIWRYSAAGDTVTGNTRCGQRRNNNSGGGGSAGFAVLLLLGWLGLLRRRAA
jgi:uncharacterized repeat protein (TIGR03803 family)